MMFLRAFIVALAWLLAAPALAQTTTYNEAAALNNNYGGCAPPGCNFRSTIPSSTLSAATGSQIRVSFLFFGGGTGGYTIGTAYIGQAGGSTGTFTGDQVQLTFSSGGTTFSSPTTAIAVVSDFVTLAQAWDPSKNYVVSYHIPGISGNLGGTLGFGTAGNCNDGANGTDTSSQTTPAGMTCASITFMVSKLEVQAGGGGGGTITYRSLTGAGK